MIRFQNNKLTLKIRWKYQINLKLLKIKNMSNKEIEQLLNETSWPCVSVIVPVHKLSPERIKNKKVVKEAISDVEMLLKQNDAISDSDLNMLIQKLDEAVETIDFNHSNKGIGIFVSPNLMKIIQFPFPVIEKINVGNIFESRDLIFYLNYTTPYYVLSIGKKHIRLFSGKVEDLHEIKNEDFPIVYHETYEYSKPSKGSSFGYSLKHFEKDKSALQEIRLIDFFSAADHLLEKYLNRHIPLVISGGKKEVADYLDITKHGKNIIGKIIGNYDSYENLKLSNLSWETVQKYFNEEQKTLLSNLHELIGNEMLAFGLEEVWLAASEGKGLELIVEKDFRKHAFIATDGSDIKLKKPFGKKQYNHEYDAVEKVIRMVREKKGKIAFVDNSAMEDFNGIALQLRYNN